MMNKKIGYMYASIICGVMVTACDDGPKTIASEKSNEGPTGVFSGNAEDAPQGAAMTGAGVGADVHSITALEVLPTTKYVYVRVKEGDEEFWIASTKQEVVVGRTYFYRGGLLKTDFQSKEYNRTFEKLYLISQLVPSDHGSQGSGMPPSTPFTPTQQEPASPIISEGSVKISELLADPKKFAGRSVQVSGTCTKVNPNIMGRNWVHLNDGTNKDQDLVVTTDVLIPEGHAVTMVGTVALDKDFGAGYQYGILLEGGTLVK